MDTGDRRDTVRQARRFARVLGSMFFAITVAGCRDSKEPSSSSENATEGPADQWAGKTCSNDAFVEGMVVARLRNAPKRGETAPDFELTDARTGRARKLSDWRGKKPVVLFFGSQTCITTREGLPLVRNLHVRFGGKAEFLMIYIREAHPLGGYGAEELTGVAKLPDPRDLPERIAAARRFAEANGIEFPVLVDSMNDTVNARWAGWPARLFFVEPDGRVGYAGQQGPWFFRPTPEFDPMLKFVPWQVALPEYDRESLEEFLTRRFPGT